MFSKTFLSICLLFASSARITLAPAARSGHAALLLVGRQAANQPRPIEFDVVSIKPAHGDGWLTRFTEDGFEGSAVPVQYLLRVAFSDEIAPPDILGKPKWAGDTYDIRAKVAPEDVSAYRLLTKQQQDSMLQNVLKERFKLRFHYGTANHAAYWLTAEGNASKIAKLRAPAGYTGAGTDEPIMPGDGMLHFHAHPGSIAKLARRLSWVDDVEHRVVVDRTNLPGYYNFDLNWCPAQQSSEPQDALACNGPSLFTALREQLGLQLKPGDATVKTLIIDNIERPTPD